MSFGLSLMCLMIADEHRCPPFARSSPRAGAVHVLEYHLLSPLVVWPPVAFVGQLPYGPVLMSLSFSLSRLASYDLVG